MSRVLIIFLKAIAFLGKKLYNNIITIERVDCMQKLFKDKKTEIGVCNFLTFIIVLGIIGTYFVIFQLGNLQRDFSAMKLITFIPMFLMSLYAFVYAVMNREEKTVFALLGVLLISIFSVTEACFGTMTDIINGRKIFEFFGEAVKGLFVFMLFDRIVSEKAMVQRIWYLALSFVILIVPAVYISLYWFESTMEFAAGFYIHALYFLHGVVLAYSLTSAIMVFVFYVKNRQKNAESFTFTGSLLFSGSLLVYEILSVINMISQNGRLEHYIDALTLVTDAGLVMIVLTAVKMYKVQERISRNKRK